MLSTRGNCQAVALIRERPRPGTSCTRPVRFRDTSTTEVDDTSTTSARGRKLTALTPREANSRKTLSIYRQLAIGESPANVNRLLSMTCNQNAHWIEGPIQGTADKQYPVDRQR